MNKKAVVLLSGGLDSILAICIMKEQGIEVEAVNFQTIFGCCKEDSARVAYDLGVGFTSLKVGDDYLKVVEKPKHGYGRGINPCVDCRGYMFDMAKDHMEKVGASFMVSGEVLGQRPMSQKKADFLKIEKDTGLQGLIVRPLSAKLLEPTLPEKAGVLDREKLFAVQGRSRKELLRLAKRYGVTDPPDPSSGCALTSPEFAKKVRDIFNHHEDYQRWEFEVLRMGRHFRLNEKTKMIMGRDSNENEYFNYLHPDGTVLMTPLNFGGSTVLLCGENSAEARRQAGEIILRYSKVPEGVTPEIQVEYDGRMETLIVENAAQDAFLEQVKIV